MPASKNALLRYKTIDACLCNRTRLWTLNDLVRKCNEAMLDYCGTSISVRTIQSDIQFMRSDRPGYNAPIVVVDKKYYMYNDPDYSITKTPLSVQDVKQLNEAIGIFKQMSAFHPMTGLEDVLCRLEDHVKNLNEQNKPVVYFEQNNQVKGLQFIPVIYEAIAKKQVLRILYQSFKSSRPRKFIFSPYILKESRNRWFVFGTHTRKTTEVTDLALDRIITIKTASGCPFYEDPTFDPETFFDDIVGVTKMNTPVETVRFWAGSINAPYILTKPIHASQQVVEQREDGSMVFQIKVIVNHELIRDLMAFGEGVRVLSPDSVVQTMRERFVQGLNQYEIENNDRFI